MTFLTTFKTSNFFFMFFMKFLFLIIFFLRFKLMEYTKEKKRDIKKIYFI